MDDAAERLTSEVRKTRYTMVVIAAIVAIGLFIHWRVRLANAEAARDADVASMMKRIHDETNEAAIRAGIPTIEEDHARVEALAAGPLAIEDVPASDRDAVRARRVELRQTK